jgi:4-hydroxy-3-methylbut-2-enyl diphosphate reductase
VQEKSREGYHIVIIGSKTHPEVVGISGWAEGPYTVIETAEDACSLHLPIEEKIWIVSQTTFNYDKFTNLVEIIEELGYHVVVTNTICNATKERQKEALELARRSDVMIVIGGKHSSNTQKLYDICLSQCKNTYYIQKLDDLVTVNFQSDSSVGITAGASTPNTIIEEVFGYVRRTEL